MGMLRITITETLSEQKWTLEGRLVQPWVSESEVLLDQNGKRASGTQVRSGPHSSDLHRQERGEGAERAK